MKFLFICSSVEMGCDGVGDYSLALCAELENSGHQTFILAINDKFIDVAQNGDISVKEAKINVMRLPSRNGFEKNIGIAREFYDQFLPDVTSLQYVPHGFDKRGVPFRFVYKFVLSFRKRVQHVMIHEAFISVDGKLKNRLIKNMQVLLLKLLRAGLNPQIINTSIPSFQDRLSEVGINSSILPLFGNIPAEKIDIEKFSLTTGIYFGSAPYHNDFNVFISQFKVALHTCGKFKLIFCGRSGERAQAFFTHLQAELGNNLEVEVLGMLKPQELSRLFQQSHFGISRVKPPYLGKSGSVIAMVEHGLPIWVPLASGQDEIESQGWQFQNCYADLIRCLQAGRDVAPIVKQSFLPEVAAQFLRQFDHTVSS